MSTLLSIQDVVAGYGRTRVLRGLSLAVPEGGCIGLCGPNGHGKSTLMKAVSGLIPVWEGGIAYNGGDLAGVVADRIVEAGLVHVPQGNQLFPGLTVAENLALGAFSRRAREYEAENRERVFELFPRLGERQTQDCRTLSGGERQMLAIAVGLMSRPRLLILDEPNLGLAPIIKEELGRAIARIAEADITLVLIEQDVHFLLGLVDHLYVVEHGEITFDVDANAEDVNHHDIVARYFGEAS